MFYIGMASYFSMFPLPLELHITKALLLWGLDNLPDNYVSLRQGNIIH